MAHPSADPDAVVAALVRGAFEYSGQKCSAASRTYPAGLWNRIRDDLVARTEALAVGDVRDFSNFTSSVIDERAFTKLSAAIDHARASADAEVIAGGTCDRSEGWYVRPTLVTTDNPRHDVLSTEYFGPLLGIFVYEDEKYDEVLRMVDETSSYALTGAVFATERSAVELASRAAARSRQLLRQRQAHRGGRGPAASLAEAGPGTNDKAGSLWNLMRWVSPRSIKENLLPPTAIDYPHMLPEA
ncbi:MAG: aldehyde dehydrogenase family protein [Propionicimonas sp.]